MKKSTPLATVLVLVMTFGIGIQSFGQVDTSQTSSKHERHPLIRKAIAALHLAANDLEDASHDFCGHREQALDAVNVAIDQLGLAIACDSQAPTTARFFQRAGSEAAQSPDSSNVTPQGKRAAPRHP